MAIFIHPRASTTPVVPISMTIDQAVAQQLDAWQIKNRIRFRSEAIRILITRGIKEDVVREETEKAA